MEPVRQLKWKLGPRIPFAFELFPNCKYLSYAFLVHEAGRAVVNEHLEYAVKSIEVRGENGVTIASLAQDNTHRIVIAFAGLVASRRVIDDALAREWSGHDFMDIHRIFDGMGIGLKEQGNLSRSCEATCEQIIEQRWKQVKAVAGALANQCCLRGDEVRTIMASI